MATGLWHIIIHVSINSSFFGRLLCWWHNINLFNGCPHCRTWMYNVNNTLHKRSSVAPLRRSVGGRRAACISRCGVQRDKSGHVCVTYCHAKCWACICASDMTELGGTAVDNGHLKHCLKCIMQLFYRPKHREHGWYKEQQFARINMQPRSTLPI